jgi:hypothetical protein
LAKCYCQKSWKKRRQAWRLLCKSLSDVSNSRKTVKTLVQMPQPCFWYSEDCAIGYARRTYSARTRSAKRRSKTFQICWRISIRGTNRPTFVAKTSCDTSYKAYIQAELMSYWREKME